MHLKSAMRQDHAAAADGFTARGEEAKSSRARTDYALNPPGLQDFRSSGMGTLQQQLIELIAGHSPRRRPTEGHIHASPVSRRSSHGL